ncbi:PLP-dependent aminotransferase family protein [Bacillus subtilis]|uniref:PLP-dependent aminotransferase family protein n=2 Tax=Bacillus subtilis TaxID=1423 RepID=A0AAQ3IDI6_BACIU|nr:PLP-dependent aminotransferase family protein [Bacillus subtilis]ASZ60057.1 PLP-dependent aminotransferase family protein [Bacillus subtilis]KIN40102.1 Transcriptional regulator, GntR family domain [Bacillus subtilis]KIN41293.1 Transcriptional regulator, GntR family domain [Bacillus subtilis]MBO3766617.1 PLP-dependent aminotransferase family protein [Bacillus subtilis]MEC0322895.1 PLP-dependent aminotransferase family protein [Bacillus subtilis]
MSNEYVLKKSSSIPLYKQIYENIKHKIMNGEWTVGTTLPTQRELARMFKVNRSTIVYALGELTGDGLIEATIGKGTVVVTNTCGLLSSTLQPNWNGYVKSGSYHPNLQIIQEINKAEANKQIIRLSTGEISPDLLPTKKTKELIQTSSRKLSLGYSEAKGNIHLREIISEHLKSKGIEASPSSILIVSGGLQSLQLISLGLLKHGSTIFLEKPSYLNSVQVFQSAGINLLGIPMDNEGILIGTLERFMRQHNGSLLYTTPSFHNPTGISMSSNRRMELLDSCRNLRLPIIEDDVYGDLWFEGNCPKSLKSLDNQGLVLYIGSTSKTLGPGLRIGWIVGPEPVIDRLSDIKMKIDYGSSSLSQFVVTEWLSKGLYYDYMIKIRKELKLRRDFTIVILHKYFKRFASWTVPTGGFYIWLSINKQISIEKLFVQALNEGILLNPGSIYDQYDHQHLRLSYSYVSFDQLERGLIRLSELIQEL